MLLSKVKYVLYTVLALLARFIIYTLLVLLTLLVIKIVSNYLVKWPSVPFEATIANNKISFPLKVDQIDLQKYHPETKYSYIWNNDSVFIQLVVDPYDYDINKLEAGIYEDRFIKGVNILLKNKGNSIDSIRKALAKQFNKPFVPLVFSGRDHIPFNNIVYSCEVNASTTIFLRAGSCPQADHWCTFSPARISIGYNLNQEEKETFAVLAHRFYEDSF